MPTNRFQFSDDFVLKNGKVGINTSEPQEKLEVLGTIIADNIIANDVSNLQTYEGFFNQNYNIDDNLSLSVDTSTSVSGEIIVGDDATVTIGSTSTSSQGNIDSLKVYNTFTVPTGGTEERPRKVKPGQLFFNKDFATMEFWDGNVWRQVDNTTRSGRGVFAGGSLSTPTYISTIQYINITTTGNSQYFGERAGDSTTSGEAQGCSSSVRGIFGGGIAPSNSNIIDYITIASQGNSINFGDLTLPRNALGSCSSSTRGVWGGGINPSATPTIFVNTIDYVQISTIGDAIDFGDLSVSRFGLGCAGSPTRGVFVSGAQVPSPVNFGLETIDFITISSKGTAVNFGKVNQGRTSSSGCSSSVRGIFAGGYNPAPSVAPTTLKSSIEYITFSSTGSSIIFGDLTLARSYLASASTQIRGVWGGGIAASPSPSNRTNIIDYVLIASTGNAQDFGDLSQPTGQIAACSDSHGGLGGF